MKIYTGGICRQYELAHQDHLNINPITTDDPSTSTTQNTPTNTDISSQTLQISISDRESTTTPLPLTTESRTSPSHPELPNLHVSEERQARRRRRRSSSSSAGHESTNLSIAVSSSIPSARTEEQRRTKRQRTGRRTMNITEESIHALSNGHSTNLNGSTPKKPVQSVINGNHEVNGLNSMHTNGSVKTPAPVHSSTWYGHSREEVTRILIQGLLDMGYSTTANQLTHESGYELENASVAAFRSAILTGDWPRAEEILMTSRIQDGNTGQYGDELVLAEGADRGQMLFWIRQQKFLELLDQRDLSSALMVLRQELTPLGHDIHQLHTLSTLLMCPPEDLRAKAHWPGSIEESRLALLQELARSIAPSVMIRDHRLAELFDGVKQSQINHCLYHNTAETPSLYSDHMCSREDFPLRTIVQLDDHSGEVWHVQFSHDGTKLASASQDRTVIIYDTTTFKPLQRLSQHSREVTYIAWSPDDTKLISCSQDCKARVWDVETGRLLVTLEHRTVDQNYTITAAAWAPDSVSFVTASHDNKSQLCYWNLSALEPEQPVHIWPSGFRAQDVAITPDGRKLIVMNADSQIFIFDMRTYREEGRISFAARTTGIDVSRDSSSVMVNLSNGQIHLIDLTTRETVRRYVGQQQGEFVIRGCFGGAAESFVLSGSEGKLTTLVSGTRANKYSDGKVYVWHKENEMLIETLPGHGKGQGGKECVTTVSWNPTDAGMFASGGDDRKIRM